MSPREAPATRITYRGWFVIYVAAITAVIAFSVATRDACWDGGGYGSCNEINSRYQEAGR